jgi:hypothetical protein
MSTRRAPALTLVVALAVLIATSTQAGAGSGTVRQPHADAFGLAGQLGGHAQGAAVDGNYAYLGAGRHMAVLDIADAAAPQLIAQSELLSDEVAEVEVAGHYAYAAAYTAGLRVFDIANPAAPTEVGHFLVPDSAQDVAVAGSYAYVADLTSGLFILDITNPANPTRIASLPPAGLMTSVAVSGGYAYYTAYGYLQVVDISNPAAPVLLGNYHPGWYSMFDVAIAGHYAYVGGDQSVGLTIVDVADPAHPTYSGGTGSTLGEIHGVDILGNYAYLASFSSALWVVDVSNPAQPNVTGYLPVSTPGLNVSVIGTRAYLCTHGGLVVADISTPATPQKLGYYSTMTAYLSAITVAGNYAYVAQHEENALHIVDVSNPAQAREAGYYHLPVGTYGIYDVAIIGHYALLACDNGLHVADVADPAHPIGVTNVNLPNAAAHITLAGNLAYVGAWSAGLHIIDVSNPAAPVALGSFPNSPGNTRGVALYGNYAYVTNSYGSLAIVDVSNPGAPAGAGTYSLANPRDLVVAGSHLYATSGSAVVVLSLTDPLHPAQVGNYAGTTSPMALSIAGNYLHVADQAGGLRILDVTNPAGPVSIVSYATPGAVDVAVSGDHVYLGDEFGGGLYIFWFDPGFAPSAYVFLPALSR